MRRCKNYLTLGLTVIVILALAFAIKLVNIEYPDLLSAVIASVLLDLTNSNRLSQGLRPLEFSPTLSITAQMKANDMAEKGYFSHISPDGKVPWQWFLESNYRFLYAGENLAVNFTDSERVVQAWMNSRSHRTNILSDKFTEIGIAIAPGFYHGRESTYVVQLFGNPAP